MSDRRTRVLCFGEALIDFIAAPPGDAAQPRAYLRHAGGAPANVAVAVAMLGGDAAFAGMIGADAFGDFLVDTMRRHGVDTSLVRRTAEANTALAFVTLADDGERSFSFYRSPSADQLFRAAHFDESAFASACAFHACSNTLTDAASAGATIAGLTLARRHGAIASVDMNLRPALWPAGVDPRARIHDALALADVIKLSAEELRFLANGGDAPRDERAVIASLWQGAARFIVITDGAAPVRWFTRTRDGHVPTIAVDAIDTTAAGDAFVGGLLHALAERGVDSASLDAFLGDDGAIEHALRHAIATGAFAVTRAGAFAAMPTRGERDRLLTESLAGTKTP